MADTSAIPIIDNNILSGANARNRALVLLVSLVSNDHPEKNERLTDLLVDHGENEYSEDWYFCIPRAFQDSLDIKLTERVINKKPVKTLTQGSEFCFSEGDILYDTSKGYEQWAEALKHFKVMVQIKDAYPAVPGRDRSPGKVTVDVWTPNKGKTGIEKLGEKEMSQDEFVKLLIAGPRGTWKEFLSEKK